MHTPALAVVLACARLCAGAALPAPARLLVEYLDNAPVVSTAHPRFSFLPHQVHDHPGSNTSMDAYRIVVKDHAGSIAWDSGKTSTTTGATSVRPETPLKPLATYTWQAQWWSAGNDTPSPTTSAAFTIGPITEADWEGSVWLGGGQNEFKLTYSLDAVSAAAGASIFVASPGGAVVYSQSQIEKTRDWIWTVVGDDEIGLSPWIDFRKTVSYQGYTIPLGLSKEQQQQQVKLQIGAGFWSPEYQLGNPFWGIPAGNAAVARVLVVGGTLTKLEGRSGHIVSDDPWMGTVTDWGVSEDDGWVHAAAVPTAPGWKPAAKKFIALQAPYSATAGRAALPVHAVSVTPLAPAVRADDSSDTPKTVSRWLYKFSRNIVGHAAVVTSAVKNTGSGAGNLTLRHCELVNTTLGAGHAFCLALAHLPDQPDSHILPAGFNTGNAGADVRVGAGPADGLLAPRFTWHGFQYVIVEADEGIQFDAKIDSVVARWTASNLEDTASISFEGPGAEMLTGIRDIVKASQLSNMAAFGPTDCPTREKHFWLGDASDTAEEAMYNLWLPGPYELFANAIRDSQDTNTSSEWYGFVKGVVPADTEGPKNKNGPGQPPSNALFPDDISWTAAYPLIVNWLHLYYGDLSTVKDHWEALKLWTDGQKRQMLPGDGLPSFFQWGDWCSPFEDRATSTKGTGAVSAAANYILSVDAMVSMATALGQTEDAKKYQSELVQWRAAYHARFWNATSGTYTGNPLEVQTITATALGAGAVPPAFQASAVKALTESVASHDYHLTVGSVGQKWLFRELTAAGAHDTALKVGLQATYPSFGYWLANGATTCWENWSGVCDLSHPGSPWPGQPGKYLSPNPPTHNHIFLCGGVGEWLYRSLGGIAPATAGYGVVTIAPAISQTEGPSAVNTSITTIRGVVKSSWKRHASSGSTSTVLDMQVQVPVGSRARIEIPLLHADPLSAYVEELHDHAVIWTGEGSVDKMQVQHQQQPTWLWTSPYLVSSGDNVLKFETTAGVFHFRVKMHAAQQ